MSSTEPVTLPHTWRPFGVRVAVVLLGGMLVLLSAFAWLGLDPEIRAKFTLFQRSTLIVLGLLFAAVGHALARSRVEATEQSMRVVNGYKSRDYDWAEVVAIHLTPGSPWATIDLADGTSASILALQGSDGERARSAVRQLRALIDR